HTHTHTHTHTTPTPGLSLEPTATTGLSHTLQQHQASLTHTPVTPALSHTHTHTHTHTHRHTHTQTHTSPPALQLVFELCKILLYTTGLMFPISPLLSLSLSSSPSSFLLSSLFSFSVVMEAHALAHVTSFCGQHYAKPAMTSSCSPGHEGH